MFPWRTVVKPKKCAFLDECASVNWRLNWLLCRLFIRKLLGCGAMQAMVAQQTTPAITRITWQFETFCSCMHDPVADVSWVRAWACGVAVCSLSMRMDSTPLHSMISSIFPMMLDKSGEETWPLFVCGLCFVAWMCPSLFGRSPVGYSPRRNRLRGDHCRYVVKLLLLFLLLLLLLLLLLKYKFEELYHSHTSPDCIATTMCLPGNLNTLGCVYLWSIEIYC